MLSTMRTLLLALLLAAPLAHAGKPGGGGTTNQVPRVYLIWPGAGSTVAPGSDVRLEAEAFDADGSVARVEFFAGTTLIGSVATLPYALVWPAVPAGTYSLSAKAVDNAGAGATSAAVSLAVAPPGVSVTTPAEGAVVFGSDANRISGTFTGAADSTVLVSNGSSSRAATVSGNTFSGDLPLFEGSNTVSVSVARSDRTSTGTTLSVTFASPPLVAFTAPVVNTVDGPATLGLAAAAVSPGSALAKVDFYGNGTLLGTATTPPYALTWNNVPVGSYTLTATATDVLGQSRSTERQVTVRGANAPPTVALTAPAGGAVFAAPATIALAASAADADGTLAQVAFYQNGSFLAGTNVAPYTFSWTNVAAGSYTLTAQATDNRGGSTTSAPVAVTVTPPNAPPAVTLASPAAGAVFTAPATIALAATANDADGSVAKVEFFSGAMLIGAAAGAPHTFDWTGVAAGSYSLTAQATDNLGAFTVSAPVAITVNPAPPNAPPTVSLTRPAVAATFDAPAMIGLAADASDADGSIARVDFFQGTTLIGSAVSAPYAFDWTGVPAGSYSLTAKATDNLGAVATSAAVAVTVKPLTLAFTAPAAGAVLSGQRVTVSGSFAGPANAGITVNGVVAAQDGANHFYAEVPLAAGSNTITATLTTPAGQSTSQSMAVTSDGLAPSIRISADHLTGLAPLTVVFTLTNEGAASADVVMNGASLTLPAGGSGTFTWNLASPGVYPVVATASDGLGNNSTQSFVMVVQDAAALDAMLKAVWGGMTDKLKAGDINGALTAVSGSLHDKYLAIFTALQADLPTVVDQLGTLQGGAFADEIGEYTLVRDTPTGKMAFLINFLRGEDGVWRIEGM